MNNDLIKMLEAVKDSERFEELLAEAKSKPMINPEDTAKPNKLLSADEIKALYKAQIVLFDLADRMKKEGVKELFFHLYQPGWDTIDDYWVCRKSYLQNTVKAIARALYEIEKGQFEENKEVEDGDKGI